MTTDRTDDGLDHSQTYWLVWATRAVGDKPFLFGRYNSLDAAERMQTELLTTYGYVYARVEEDPAR